MRSAMSLIAVTTSGAGRNPSWATKRAARIILSGSSLNELSGVAGVRINRCARSVNPPYGSTNLLSGIATAMALIVKSRRKRSSSSVSPNATSGFRLCPG